VREVGDQVLFLHQLQPGGADRSYGIEVGRLAGLPAPVLRRAREVLKLLEGGHLVKDAGGRRQDSGGEDSTKQKAESRGDDAEQLALFAARAHPVVERLRELDPNLVTPMQALQLLAELVEEADG
jgi:DNA mismatch repair protein MutS